MNWQEILNAVERGERRSAKRLENGNWEVDIEVKKAILECFRSGKNIQIENFIDKDTLPTRKFGIEDGVRFVPGGSSVRRGTYIAPSVIIMPPSYVNIGAYVDRGTMIDSHVLVGSCAQIGKNVHLSAGVQIGGVLEPIGLSPVIIEDSCFLGANCVVVEGIRVKQGAVLAPGVILSKAVSVYDAVKKEIRERGADIPENAVVVPGTRPVSSTNGWAQELNLQVHTPIIIKYRDEKSDASLELENALRK